MILKKPYKFLLKHFKLIHFILVCLTIYLTNKTGRILNFFNEYDAVSKYVSTDDLASHLFNIYVFVIPLIIAVSMIVIIYLLSLKDKPKKFYTFNVVIFLLTILVNLYTYNVCTRLETQVIDIRVIKAIENIYLMIYAIEVFDIIFMSSRVLGFNIKEFNFNGDEDLAIGSIENEEFELNLEFDTNKTKRNIKRNIRYLSYTYKENKLYINIFLLIFISILGTLIYFNYFVKNKIYHEKEYLNVDGFSFRVEDSFITNYDNDGNIITENNLIIVKINIKKLNKLKEKLISSKIDLYSDDLYFKQTKKYNDYISDIGNLYDNQIISDDKYSEYILIFEVPIGYENNLKLRYNYGKNKNQTIKLKPKNFNKNSFDVEANLNEELTIDDDVIKNTTLTISSYEIDNSFKINYKYKAYNEELYDSYEYIVPDYIDNCDKVILKLSGNLQNDKLSFSKFVEKYGKIEYTKDNETNIIDTKLRSIVPVKTMSNDSYFSVCNEVLNSERINLIFKIRGNIYRFNLDSDIR